MNVRGGFRFSRAVESFIGRNLTPPYLSASADIQHAELGKEPVLILCSDGLTDSYPHLVNNTSEANIAELGKRWVGLVEYGSKRDANLGLILLRDALGGEDAEKVSKEITLESESKWRDDITVLVERL